MWKRYIRETDRQEYMNTSENTTNGELNEIFKINDRIYTLGQKRSSYIRELLDIFNINDKLTQYKINWREHKQRIDDNRLLLLSMLLISRSKDLWKILMFD